ncbi:hypothetical protein DXG03_002235 [Asterophora parasitica]|uniref:Uncharacterized protein n=1 Tax=Asterophora parasitica TaxID=117018 RepID=A0A9P7G4K8_9AGAR|nr:hypothetical protein DXG03_002235 [Asterophora parasitica]
MTQGSLSGMDFACSGRPDSFSAPQAGPSSRTSVLSSVVPYLRRIDINGLTAHQKVPLLTLKLSSPSFLDSVVTDDATKQPLYTIRTSGVLTKITRADPWDRETKTAEIQWPRSAPAKGKGTSDGVLIQMRGLRWKGSETFLRRGSILRHCTTAAVKGPLAILDPATDSFPPQLNVFESLHDKYDVRPMLVHHGVSILLLDYLLVTALLLVTDIQDWMLVKKLEDIVVPIGHSRDLPRMSPPKPAPGNTSTSNLQWRKIMYGEPLFPKWSSQSSAGSDCTTPDSLTPAALSAEQLAKVAYGHPLFPSLRSSSPTPTVSSESASDHMFFYPLVPASISRPPSPSSESIFNPQSRSNAPSHTYLDPSFYNKEDDIPPVPPLPVRFTSSTGSSRGSRLRPLTSTAPTNSSTHDTNTMRRLPEPPLPPVPPLIHRRQSTPLRSMSAPSPTTPHTNEHPDLALPLALRRSFDSPATPTTPRRSGRQLPQPPSMITSSAPPTPLPVRTDNKYSSRAVALSRSHSQSHSLRSAEKWSTYRTLPAPPSTPRTRQGEDGRVSSQVKSAEEWMGVGGEESGGAAAVYDTPPPAYNSINFLRGVEHGRQARGEVSSSLPTK